MDGAASKPAPDSLKLFRRLITQDYKYLTQHLMSNEEMGEKRVSLFLTLTSGLGAAVLLTRDKVTADPIGFEQVFLMILAAWLLFGYLTFLRIVHRNIVTDRIKHDLDKIRQWFVKEDDERLCFLPYHPYKRESEEPKPQPPHREVHSSISFFHGNGGYAELVALINCCTAFAFGRELLMLIVAANHMMLGRYEETWAGVAGLVFALVSWFVLAWVARKKYAAARKKPNQDSHPA